MQPCKPGLCDDAIMRRPAFARTAACATIVAAIALTAAACATAAGGDPPPTDPARIAESARSLGIAPDLVYTTAVEGYDLAPQSVGPSDAEGMSTTWFHPTTHGTLTIRTARGDLTQESCEAMPLEEAFGEPVMCTEENGVWHRSAAEAHEYMTARAGVVIRVSGSGAPLEDIRAAAEAVHVPSRAELEMLFSDAPVEPSAPVERRDLPEHGDGAPVDRTGPGG